MKSDSFVGSVMGICCTDPSHERVDCIYNTTEMMDMRHDKNLLITNRKGGSGE